ncbi:Alginate lyase [Paenibacillus catalpae]|uniref:Alginate lyase n=1 Tax=Paenibacillus catalpae TaxID=1045775 RepID=A0A1I1T8Y0_9BACL|nr:alginate lyase family protein [Paenibacillus catalpae]SFD52763.1 Alginate lyase [Paenibacillus catalpae]
MNHAAVRDELLRMAKDSLTISCHAVPVWHIPGFYFDTDSHLAAKRLMETDVQAAYTTALAYRLTGNTVFADKAMELIQGWAAVNREITDKDGPLVSAYLGAGLLQAAEWIKTYPGWQRAEQEQFVQWTTLVLLPEWDQIPLRNNWWSWSLYAQLLLYRFMGDTTAFAEEAANLKEHIDSSLSLTGFIPEETTRGTNAIWYHYFALAPLTAAAKQILDVTGEDLFRWISPGGKSIKQALDTLFYYADGRAEEWPYEQGQNFPSPLTPRSWPLDLYEAMSRVYEDPEYDRFVSSYRPIIGNMNRNSGYFQSYAWVFPELL